jgi:hypothetical protein
MLMYCPASMISSRRSPDRLGLTSTQLGRASLTFNVDLYSSMTTFPTTRRSEEQEGNRNLQFRPFPRWSPHPFRWFLTYDLGASCAVEQRRARSARRRAAPLLRCRPDPPHDARSENGKLMIRDCFNLGTPDT